MLYKPLYGEGALWVIAMSPIVSPGIYKHFKGNHYQVIDIARHSETEQWMVLYKPLYGEGALWVRPLELFCDYKEIEGIKVPRFEWVRDR